MGLSQDFLRTFSELSQGFLRIFQVFSQDFLRTFPEFSLDFFRTFSELAQDIQSLALIALALLRIFSQITFLLLNYVFYEESNYSISNAGQ